jgi:hypothetical protein
MLLLYIIDLIYPLDPNRRHNFQSILKTFQNIYCFTIVAYAGYAIYTAKVDTYLTAIQIIHWQCIFDMLLCKPELVLHHIFVLHLTTPFLQIPGLANHTHEGVATILSTEISTIFLSLREFIPQRYTTLNSINNTAFICMFAYTRIYNYSNQLIYNEPLHNKLTSYLSTYNSCLIITAMYGLFFLNIYWAAIILKTIVKQFKSKIPSFQQCESMIKYMFFTSPLVSLFIYRPFTNPVYFIDTIGQGMLAISSYEYHKAASQQNIDKSVLDHDIIWTYINDVLLIHIRCFFCILTNTNLYTSLTHNLPIMNLQMGKVYFSLLLHTASVYHFVKYLFTLKQDNHSLTINDTDAKKLAPLQFLQGFPILIDSLIIAFSTNSLTHRNNMLLITVLIFINGKVAPFYQMNHLVFHILLLLQTIFLCQSNIAANDHMIQSTI